MYVRQKITRIQNIKMKNLNKNKDHFNKLQKSAYMMARLKFSFTIEEK